MIKRTYLEILKHSSIYSLGNILGKIVGFVMIPIYTRYLTPDDYGVLELLTLVATVIMAISLRLASGLPRYYYKFDTEKDRNELVSSVLILIGLVSATISIILILNKGHVSNLVFDTSDYKNYFVYIFISFVFEMCATVAAMFLRILQKSVFFITINLIQLIIGLSLNIYLIVYLQLGIHGILISMVLANGISTTILVVYTLFKVGIHFSPSKLVLMIRFGLPLMPAGLLIFILNMGDRFILNKLSNLTEVGIYALGYKFGMLLGVLIGGPFQTMWGPKRNEIYEKDPQRDRIFTQVLTYFILVMAFAGLIISVLIQDILTIMVTPEFLPAYRVVPLIVIGYLFYYLYYVVDIGYYVKEKTYWYLIINLIAAATNVGLNFILIPKYGSMGAAFVTAITFCICPVIAYFVSQRYHRLNYEFWRIFKIIVIVILYYWLCEYINLGTLILNLTLKTVMLATFPFLMYMIGFFNEGETIFIKTNVKNGLEYLRLKFR